MQETKRTHFADKPATLAGRLLQIIFKQLYSNFAWAYDFVAAVVSFGEWKQWGRAVIPFLPKGQRLLEVGHGPGHLHLTLRQQGYPVIGIDLSPQMNHAAQRRLARTGLSNTLAQANVFRLPFPDEVFGALISTFPTEYISDPEVLAEAYRVLAPDGRLLVVPDAPLRTTGFTGVAGRFIRLLYGAGRSTQEVFIDVDERFMQAGFRLTEYHNPTPRADVMVWVCEKVEVIPRMSA